jgi:hypothetical protein
MHDKRNFRPKQRGAKTNFAHLISQGLFKNKEIERFASAIPFKRMRRFRERKF